MKPLHLLDGIETFGKDFPIKVPFLIQELSKLLNIEIVKFDKSTDSLKLLDMALYGIKKQINEEFVNANLMKIEAYLGEVFIKNYGGSWKVEYEPNFNIFVPFVSINGKKVSFYPDTMESLLEWDIPDIEFCFTMAIPRELR